MVAFFDGLTTSRFALEGIHGASRPSVVMPVRMTRVLGPVALQRLAVSVVLLTKSSPVW